MNDHNDIMINEQLTILQNELQFRFSTSSGPGGQHANRAATRVTLLFDVAQSPSLNETQRGLLRQRLAGRLDQNGVLQLHEQSSRSQYQNRTAVTARFQKIIAAALQPRKKRRPTHPSRAACEKRLAAKRHRREKKAQRRKDW